MRDNVKKKGKKLSRDIHIIIKKTDLRTWLSDSKLVGLFSLVQVSGVFQIKCYLIYILNTSLFSNQITCPAFIVRLILCIYAKITMLTISKDKKKCTAIVETLQFWIRFLSNLKILSMRINLFLRLQVGREKGFESQIFKWSHVCLFDVDMLIFKDFVREVARSWSQWLRDWLLDLVSEVCCLHG